MASSKLNLDVAKIAKARELSKQIAAPVSEYIDKHTTVAIERTTLRMMGADGIDANGVPVPNKIVDQLGSNISYGATKYYINALLKKGLSPDELNKEIANGLDISKLDFVDFSYIEEKSKELVEQFASKVKTNVAYRNEKVSAYKEKQNSPLL